MNATAAMPPSGMFFSSSRRAEAPANAGCAPAWPALAPAYSRLFPAVPPVRLAQRLERAGSEAGIAQKKRVEPGLARRCGAKARVTALVDSGIAGNRHVKAYPFLGRLHAGAGAGRRAVAKKILERMMHAVERRFRAFAGLARLQVQGAQLRLQAFGGADVRGRALTLADLMRRHHGCPGRRCGHGLAQALDRSPCRGLKFRRYFPYPGGGGEDFLRGPRNTVRVQGALLRTASSDPITCQAWPPPIPGSCH